MAAVAVVPIVLKNATIKIDADSYEAATSGVTFVPTVNRTNVTFKGLTPTASFSFPTADPSEWVCNIDHAQDWATAASLSNYLHEHEGEEVAAEFVPEAGSGLPKFTATLTIVPGSIGGTVDQVAVSSVSLPSTKPVKGLTV